MTQPLLTAWDAPTFSEMSVYAESGKPFEHDGRTYRLTPLGVVTPDWPEFAQVQAHTFIATEVNQQV